MEKGALRCEPNISVRTLEQKEPASTGPRWRSRTSTAFRAVRNAIAYELERQVNVITSGGAVEQVNMGWDEERQRTVVQRSKEDAHDYRYFPEPDLPPLHVSRAKWRESPPPCPSCPRPSAIATNTLGACGASRPNV